MDQTLAKSLPKDLSATVGGELLSSFPKHLRYARASEASTLFIHENLASSPPYLRIEEKPTGVYWAEDFDGKQQRIFHITQVERKNNDLLIELVPTTKKSGRKRNYTIYPYRDIDNTFVVIQAIDGQEEKPVRWAIPAQFGHLIDIMPEGYP